MLFARLCHCSGAISLKPSSIGKLFLFYVTITLQVNQFQRLVTKQRNKSLGLNPRVCLPYRTWPSRKTLSQHVPCHVLSASCMIQWVWSLIILKSREHGPTERVRVIQQGYRPFGHTCPYRSGSHFTYLLSTESINKHVGSLLIALLLSNTTVGNTLFNGFRALVKRTPTMLASWDFVSDNDEMAIFFQVDIVCD